ncbi:uncharacterized protein [Typha angustifolia]|uniref:uncharacterized protein n=1 Tax=Typha angustifolia TaxID=59011 RepID=UPI003C2B96F6
MGSKFSSHTESSSQPTAKVIAADGSLKEYTAPTSASAVLGDDIRSHFLCNSDALYFDADIPALGHRDRVQVGQLYFVLPNAKLGHALTGVDMAALAVKASAALASRRRGGSRKTIRVMPVEEMHEVSVGVGVNSLTISATTSGSNKRSMAKKRVYVHGKAPLRTLSTIQEVAE